MTRVAVTGGTGFVGRHVVGRLLAAGHEVVVVGRPGAGRGGDSGAGAVARARVAPVGLADVDALARAFDGCEAVVHCAGINRELGAQTYDTVHVTGTANVVAAARRAGARRIAILSFLRARPDGPGPYHRSKWAAEELVRASGLDWTVIKAGVIHGRGDHMLDHLSRAFQTFPVFGLVGLRDRPVAPLAVDDVARLLEAAALGDPRLARRTIAALGPEALGLGVAVRRVAGVVGRRPLFVPLPIRMHRLLAIGWEATMRVPLVARAQVEILAEGIVEPLPFAEPPPPDLAPRTPFSAAAIAAGLPEPGGFGRADCRCLAERSSRTPG